MNVLLLLSLLAFVAAHLYLIVSLWRAGTMRERALSVFIPGATILLALRRGEKKASFAWVLSLAVFTLLVVVLARR
jgi:uncharacterized membrane protein